MSTMHRSYATQLVTRFCQALMQCRAYFISKFKLAFQCNYTEVVGVLEVAQTFVDLAVSLTASLVKILRQSATPMLIWASLVLHNGLDRRK